MQLECPASLGAEAFEGTQGGEGPVLFCPDIEQRPSIQMSAIRRLKVEPEFGMKNRGLSDKALVLEHVTKHC